MSGSELYIYSAVIYQKIEALSDQLTLFSC